MKLKINTIRLLFLIILIICTTNCTRDKIKNYFKIREYLDTIQIINTHEHQRNPYDFSTDEYNFYHILNLSSYLKADLVSAGAPQLSLDIIEKHNLDELWDMYGPYLQFSSNTTFYHQFLYGFQVLYDFEDITFTRDNIQSLSPEIAKNYSDYDSWFDTAFKKAGFSIMFVDQYWNKFNAIIDHEHFALVLNIGDLVTCIKNRPSVLKDASNIQDVVFKRAKEENFTIGSLDDYLAYADHIFHQFLDHQVVCVKNSLAYGRTLKYGDVPYRRAKKLFARKSSSLNESERKELQDFMFHWVIKKSIKYDLPIQIHTGYLAGSGNTLENSRPIKLNNLFLRYPKAKFVLFHGGYPWMGEFIALGKMFPNVFLDLVWLPQISREAAIRALHEMLDCVPYNKIFWGGDCHLIEESVGSLQIGKEVVSQVLAERINKGLITEDTAYDIARRIFRENAIDVFKLKGKLGKDI